MVSQISQLPSKEIKTVQSPSLQRLLDKIVQEKLLKSSQTTFSDSDKEFEVAFIQTRLKKNLMREAIVLNCKNCCRHSDKTLEHLRDRSSRTAKS
jgi:hypothetical protein